MCYSGNLQLVDVLFVDLVEGGEMVVVGGVILVCLVFLLFVWCDGFDWYCFSCVDQWCGFEYLVKVYCQCYGENGGDVIGWVFFCWWVGEERLDQGGQEGQYVECKQV